MNRSERYRDLIEKLRKRQIRLVLAESCTGGLVAARLTEIGGASEVFCGSMVTYRDAVKAGWLGISADMLLQHSAVSAEVTREMARAVLRATPEASLAVAITGHLGPDAPQALDGVLYAAILWRETPSGADSPLIEVRHRLQTLGRVERQQEAAEFLLRWIEESVSRPGASASN